MQPDLESIIRSNKRKLFVGIGNILKRDDGVGVYVASRICEKDTVKTLVVEVSIENYIGKINSFSYDVLILIDAVDFGQKPGFYQLMTPDKIMDFSTNTHNISIPKLVGFFKPEVFILGIQPESVSLGEDLSAAVTEQADQLLKRINAA